MPRQVEFPIKLTINQYLDSNIIHFCFLIKIKSTNEANDVGNRMVTVRNFFARWIKEF